MARQGHEMAPNTGLRVRARIVLAALLAASALSRAADEASGSATLPCLADTSIHAYPGEPGGEACEWAIRGGRDPQIKIKHRENLLALRFDLQAIPARAKITSATLRLHLEGGPGYALNHVCASTIPTDWDEATASFLEAAEGRPWGPGKLHFCAVTFGNFGTLESVGQAKDAGGGWWEVPVEPRVVHALRDSYGLAVQDETGIFAGKLVNIFVSSRETKEGPRLAVAWTGADPSAPSPVKEVSVSPAPDEGSVFLQFVCGGNDADQGTALGYEIRYAKGEALTEANWARAAVLPRVLTPRPKAPGTRVRVFLEGLEAGAEYSFGIVAYDESGNRSPLAASKLGQARERTADRLDTFAKERAVEKGGPLARGPLSIWACEALQQVDPVSGQVLAGEAYQDVVAREGNTVFDGQAKRVRLTALKGEQADFQVILETSGEAVENIRLTPSDLASGGGKIPSGNMTLGRVWYLKAKGAWYPNAVPNLREGETLRIPASDNVIAGQKLQAVYVNCFVPYAAEAGEYTGSIAVESSAGKAELPVALRVVDLAMPKRLHFEVELNQYVDRQPKEAFHDLHRLAHLHRAGYNVLPYSHDGTPTVSYVPPVAGWGKDASVTDWSAWDAYLGPLLDGGAFKDLPRAGEPLRWSYLPFYENYPMPLYKGYKRADLIRNRPAPNRKGEYEAWRDKVGREEPLIEGAFHQEWLDGNRAVTAQYLRHFEEKGWTKTKYQVMCNNVPFKGNLTSWTLDEPAWGRDFRALALFYKTFVQAARDAGTKIEVVPRNGISRPEWQGDRMDEVSEFNDISGSTMRGYYPLIRRRMLERGDTYWTYGGGLSVAKDLAMLEALLLEAWCRGQIGILPAWTAFDGGAKGWDEDHELALALPGAHGYSGWTATLKLKALRRAQQDAELFGMLASRPGWDRWRVSRAVTAAVDLAGRDTGRRPEDAAATDYYQARQGDFVRIRRAVIEKLVQTR